MISEKMQNEAWRSLPNDFKSEIKKVYNRTCYSMAALNVNNTLDWLFGIGNLTEDKQKEEERKEREMLKKLKQKYEK